MVEITVIYNDKGTIEQVRVGGHAGYANKGEDIVCAAFSTLVQALITGIEDVLGYSNFYSINRASNDQSLPEMTVTKPEGSDVKVDILFKTFVISTIKITDNYSEYAKFTEVHGK